MLYFVKRKEIPYIFLTMILGTFNHFLYHLSGKNPLVALFAPINESTWEHLKLLFFPFLLFSLLEYIILQPKQYIFFGSRILGVWIGMLSIIFLFYGYSGAIGTNFGIINIIIYYLSVLITYNASQFLYRTSLNLNFFTILLGWSLTILFFFLFTCFPPELPLFLPPIE